MVTIHQQFIALQKAAHKRAIDLTTESPVKGSILHAAAYEVLVDAIAALPLDNLAGEPALGESEMECGVQHITHISTARNCILKVGHEGPHVFE